MIRASRSLNVTWTDPSRHGVDFEQDTVPVGSARDPKERSAEDLAARALSVSDSYVRRSAGGPAADGLAVKRPALERASQGGRGLDDDVRARMETGFGADFGDVRVHEGPQADDLARGMGASAFARGSDIYFAKGQYEPGTPTGDHVLAHELAHTVEADGGNDLAHRFPANVLSSPIAWTQLSGNVFRPGEGASGGVYIVTAADQNAPVKKVVVKPVFGLTGIGTESPEQLAYGDLALARLFGIRAPKSRMVKGGREFADLVQVCKPRQPARDPNNPHWKPLEEAQGFVVMSEVPNPTSIGGLIQDAPTKEEAGKDLVRTVFSSTFLSDLGRLCVADMILGNDDRIMLGAMNFGNLMIEMGQDGGTLHAIDTTAKLPKIPRPEAVAKAGGESGGGFFNLKKQLDAGSGQVIDDFMGMVVRRVKERTPPPVGENAPPPLWQVIEAQYQNGRQKYASDFALGWQDMLVTALELSSPGSMRELESSVEGLEHQGTGLGSLRTNLAYAGGRAGGESHEDAIGRPMGIAMASMATEVDRNRLQPPMDDALAAGRFVAPDTSVLGAEYTRIPGLPSAGILNKTVPRQGRSPLLPFEYDMLDGMPPQVMVAHSQVDRTVGETKSRGRLGKKKEVPRNRNVAGHAIIDAVAVAAGANRLADAMALSGSITQQLDRALAAKFTPGEVTQVADLMNFLSDNQQQLLASVAAYKAQVAAGRSAIKRTKLPGKAEYAENMGITVGVLDKSTEFLREQDAKNLKQVAKILVRSNKPSKA